MVDLTTFPFNELNQPRAGTLTEAIAAEPVDHGFVVVTLQGDPTHVAAGVRAFVAQLRLSADQTGFLDALACRQLRRDEMGGTVPFDQAFCESVLDDVAARRVTQSDRFPGLRSTADFVLGNSMADWVLMITFSSSEAALAAARAWGRDDSSFATALGGTVDRFTINAFENTMRYARVSLDPDAIQFFNLFPGPGDPHALATAWEEVLPRYFDAAEIRSSFPLRALDPEQPLILVNFAHADSVKHFLLSMIFDPNFLEDVERCYVGRGFAFPRPFFCKVVPV